MDLAVNPTRQDVRRHLDEQRRFAIMANDEHPLRPEEGSLGSLAPAAPLAGDRQSHVDAVTPNLATA
jgi:hypothetical protein